MSRNRWSYSHWIRMVSFGAILLVTIISAIEGQQPSDGSSASSTPPNIIFIYGDDLGWNDVSFHGSPEIPTPNIDALAMNGITLDNYYGEWLCTPSRAALLSGIYPIYLGLQHYIIETGEPSALPLAVVTLPQHLKNLGYSTHMIGKWHLGYMKTEYTPAHRGFDTFFGYYNGAIDHYDYTVFAADTNPPSYGVDLHNGTTPVRDFRGTYCTHTFAQVSKKIIQEHDTSKPLFMYLAHADAHVGNSYEWQQAPADYIKRFMYITDLNRRTYAAKVSTLDDAVGVTFEALYEKGMLANTIVVFASDNGGEKNTDIGGYASNYPLRGKKQTLWQGGVRLPALVWSPLLHLSKPRIATQFMHVTDWLPTLYAAAGGSTSDLGIINGTSMWEALLDDTPSPRTELLHNIDPFYGYSALTRGDLKVINGSTDEGYNAWYGPSGFEYLSKPESMEDWVFKNGSVVRDILEATGQWIIQDADQWYSDLVVECTQPPPSDYGNCTGSPCLFNTTADPCEYDDISADYPDVVETLMEAIYTYASTAAEPQSTDVDPNADPACHNFTHVPWLDPQTYVVCDYAANSTDDS